ncbi:bifunctional aminoglycoside phosphotransferase/ATP-binding protein [Salinactinospora qingdaonensis]|uniref:AAA family ATPase n=1 Tax=Salinactinospora qingdaonensis TaxID=702744 RepID=A0ABP7GJQ0_9ACTN
MQSAAVGAAPYAEVHETHAGVVFLVGEHAYKLKKPEDFGFLDYSTRELRRAACHREVELNERLAPDVYQGVLDVVGPDAVPVDHLVAMRRMPDERRLSTLVRDGADIDDELRRIAHLLAAFHSRAERGPEIAREGTAAALRDRWMSSLTQIRPFQEQVLGGETPEIERLAMRFIDGRGELFASRIADDRIVDGHGDLLAGDIFCLDDGPRVLDCLEFDNRLRWVDGLDDAAFLAMDLERLGAPQAAATFLRAYADFVGDPAPAALHHHYIAYRAFVRAKVACLRQAQGDGEAAAEARMLERIALEHLHRGAVRLIIVGGSPATGKTTVAEALADRLGMTLLSSDRVRKERAGLGHWQSAAAGYKEGIYTEEASRAVYGELLRRAQELLSRGESVIVDASWSDALFRSHAEGLAATTLADFVELRCTAPEEVVAQRLAHRATAGSVSDADATIARSMAAAFHPWPKATPLDTSRPMRDVLTDALALAAPRPAVEPWHPHRPVMTAD